MRAPEDDKYTMEIPFIANVICWAVMVSGACLGLWLVLKGKRTPGRRNAGHAFSTWEMVRSRIVKLGVLLFCVGITAWVSYHSLAGFALIFGLLVALLLLVRNQERG
jgi:hypothetical protein